jgi:asparagine synthase (glutamine-hydrolysing)
MNMAYSLEARSPFLDHKLVEYLAKFPSNMKIKGRSLKYILRKYAAEHLPVEITKRHKQGFMFPIAHWFRKELYEFIKSTLLNSHFVNEGYFEKEYINKLIEDHRNSRVDNHSRIWMLINLEIWHQLYIENKSYQFLQDKIESEYKIAV